MDSRKRNLRGSEKRDIFKQKHKTLNREFYATDADFCLVSKVPPGTVAYFDYKGSGEGVTFSEAIQYNEWMKTAPVFIVEGKDPENGPFTVRRYLGANWRPNPPDVNYGDPIILKDWPAFGKWELSIRNEYKRRGGWRGFLQTYDY